jgi:membrane associated rhomboid family serine protease
MFVYVRKLRYLETELVKTHKVYLYETITSIFFHMNMLHWFNNTVMAFFMMSAIEYMWRPSVILALLVGISTNLYVALLFSGVFMGLSGVLAGALGIYVAYLIANYTYLSTTYPDSSFVFWMYSCCFLILMLVTSNIKSTSLHFIGLGLGIIVGMGFVPRHVPVVSDQMSLIFKILSAIAMIVPLVIILAS